MKIGIDISQIVYGTGVSNYTENLIRNLLMIDRKNEYLFFGGSLRRTDDLRLKIHEFKGSSETKIWPIPPTLADLVWNRFHVLNIEVFTGKLDVFHSSDWTQPPSKAFKVTTIHDLSPILFPRYTDPKVVETHRRRLHWVIKEAQRIIVPSETSKKDLVRLGASEGNVRVIPEAVGDDFKPARREVVNKIKKKYRIYGTYLLFVGTNPRKNLVRAVRAFENARGEGMVDELVIVGGVESKIKDTQGVKMVGYVDTRDLVALYSGASALLYPSLYEGFGLPILEAMATGCPVVTSNLSSMPEVAGKAAVLVNPKDIVSISEGIRTAIRRASDLKQKGFKRIKIFSWEETARETLKVYEESI